MPGQSDVRALILTSVNVLRSAPRTCGSKRSRIGRNRTVEHSVLKVLSRNRSVAWDVTARRPAPSDTSGTLACTSVDVQLTNVEITADMSDSRMPLNQLDDQDVSRSALAKLYSTAPLEELGLLQVFSNCCDRPVFNRSGCSEVRIDCFGMMEWKLVHTSSLILRDIDRFRYGRHRCCFDGENTLRRSCSLAHE